MAPKRKQTGKKKHAQAIGPVYPSRLLKELGQPLELNDRSRRFRKKAAVEEPQSVADDVYEFEEGVPQEESKKNRRFDDIDKLEYELPSDFEDEEIDEDAAFGEERPSKAGHRHEEDDENGSDGDSENQEEDDDELHSRMLEEVTGKSRSQGRKTETEDRCFTEEPEQPITFEDLLAPLQEQPGFNALKKRMRNLQKHAAPVSVPLPKILQEKLDRKVGYEKTKEEISKWQPIVKQNREAATMNFINNVDVSLPTVGSMASDFKPSTEFEREIASLLQESGACDPYQIEAAESLELNKLSVEEVRNRQERLAKMRSLLFRHEERAKRVKRIKSKAFHRIARKSKTRPDMLIEDPELQKEEAMQQEKNRAEERFTLKHKNSTRWAKRIIRRGLHQHDDGTREAITEQLRRHALLTQKIHSANMVTSSDDDSSDLDEEPEGLVLEKPGSKILAKAKIQTLKALEEGDNQVELPKTGLFALPFMVRGFERKRKEAADEAKAVLEQLEQAEEDDADANQDALLSGKLSFGGCGKQNSSVTDVEDKEIIERGSDSEKSEDESAPTRKDHKKKKMASVSVKDFYSKESNLDGLVEAPVEHTVRVDEPTSIDGTAKSKKKNKKKNKRQEAKSDQKTSVIKANPTIFGAGKITSSGGNEAISFDGSVTIAGRPRKPDDAEESDEKGEEEEEQDECEEDEDGDNVIVPRSQEDLIREAFAGDDVEAEFEQMKADAANEEAPRGANDRLDLPGWGQWTEIQKKKGPPKWMIREQEELKKQQEEAKKRRMDAKLKDVIVSEKTSKKATKFQSSALPFPYTSKEVFEKSMRMPLGPDYNTNQSFRELTRPSEIKRAGVIIDPIQYEKPKPNNKRKQQTAQAPQKLRKIRI